MQLLNCHLPDLCCIDYYIDSFFSFALMQKKQKIKEKIPLASGTPFFRATAQRLRLF